MTTTSMSANAEAMPATPQSDLSYRNDPAWQAKFCEVVFAFLELTPADQKVVVAELRRRAREGEGERADA